MNGPEQAEGPVAWFDARELARYIPEDAPLCVCQRIM